MGVCNCSMYCCTLLYVILVLQSSWWGRESWLLCLICLPGVSWWLSGSSSRCHRVVCSLWLWYFLIILTYYFSINQCLLNNWTQKRLNVIKLMMNGCLPFVNNILLFCKIIASVYVLKESQSTKDWKPTTLQRKTTRETWQVEKGSSFYATLYV